MDGVGAEVDGALWGDEVVKADTALRGEVPDAGVGVGSVVGEGKVGVSKGGVLVVGPKQAAGGLGPRGKATGSGEVPAEDDGGDGNAGEGAADGIVRAAEAAFAGGDLAGAGVGCGEAAGLLGFGGEGLPKGKKLGGVLEVAAEEAGAVVAGEDLAGVDTGHKELEIVAILRQADTALDEGSEFQRKSGGGGLSDAFLCVSGRKREQSEGGGEKAVRDAAERQARAPGRLGMSLF